MVSHCCGITDLFENIMILLRKGIFSLSVPTQPEGSQGLKILISTPQLPSTGLLKQIF